MSNEIKAVVFDLDDTLISEKQFVESGYRCVAEIISGSTGIGTINVFEMLKELFNKNTQNVFNRLFDKLQIRYDNDNIRGLVEEYRNHLPDIQFYDDVIPCLEKLKDNGIKTGIITDGYISTQRKKLKALNAEKYFDHIILTEELGREYWKPHPRAFELMNKILQVKFDEMVYVGDNPEKDFYIGHLYPIKTVRICREGLYNNRSYLENIEENHTICCLLDMLSIFK